jgi:hypothetical protein
MSDKLFVFNLNIEDALWSKTMYISIAFIYVMIGITFSAKYLRINNELEEIECQPDFLTFLWMFSWIFGKSSEETVQKCMFKGEQKLIQHIQSPVIQKINDAKQRLDTKMEEIDLNMDRLQDAYDKSEGKVNNLAIAIQNNILAVKEGMQKIIAALVIQKHMNDGSLAVVKQNKSYDKMFTAALTAVKK